MSKDHPALPFISARAAEAGLDPRAINRSAVQRAMVTLTIDLLDEVTPTVLAHPDLLPLFAATLHGFADLISRSEKLIEADPALTALVHQHARRCHGGDHE